LTFHKPPRVNEKARQRTPVRLPDKNHNHMKSRILLSTALIFSLAGGAFAADEDTPLTKEMSTMNKSLRTIKRQLADPAKKADNLELIGKVKKAIDTGHGLDPKKTKDQADKVAYTKKFKEQMIELGKTVGELEAAIKVDKQDDAKKALDKIYQLKEKGHKDFGVDDE
jgi:phage-related minor tail protein